MPNKKTLVLLAVLLAATRAGAIDLVEDAPTLKPPKSGELVATITPAEQIDSVAAVSRVNKDQVRRPDSFDRKTGKIVFKNLPGDARYDLTVKTRDGRRIEGIDLDFVDSRMLRLAEQRRKELRLPPERSHEFVQADADALLKWVKDLKDFMDIRRVLYVQGQGRRATMLVELMRARDFYARAGDQVIWRVELWYFENQFGGWDRTANQERVLHRQRIPRSEWENIHLEYYAELSAYIPPEGGEVRISFQIPPAPDASHGRIPNSEPKIETKPYILGLTEKASGQLPPE